MLFSKIEQFINKIEDKSYDEAETEVNGMVKVAYANYTGKYNKFNKAYWIGIKLSLVLSLIAIVIWLVDHLL